MRAGLARGLRRMSDARPSDGRAPPSRQDGARRVLNIATYVPYFLAAVNNALSAGASAHYLKEFGFGVGDWRVLSMVAVEPGVAASRICDLVALDKGAVSRSLRRLHAAGFVTFEAAETDPRRKAWTLTSEGYDLHDRMLSAALDRESRLIDGITPDDLAAFLRAMRIMRKTVQSLR